MHSRVRLGLLSSLLTAALLSTATGPATTAPSSHSSRVEPVTSVIAISIDGLNPDALAQLGREGTPHLHRLIDQGASTLNARTERELTLTLPNHTGMVTGRRITARSGGHGVTWNDDRTKPATVQAASRRPVESVFSTIRAAGGNSALFASKTKFSLFKRSWPQGVNKSVINLDNPALVRRVERDLATKTRTFRFVHLSMPDNAGHANGWMSRPYMRAVRRVDRLVGRIVAAIDANPALAHSTALILTSDHGGIGLNHGDPTVYGDYRVAFMVAGPGVQAGADLYDLNPDYRDPAQRRTTYAGSRQPVRNGDVANLALDLLGLGPVKGSEHNYAQNLDVAPE